MEVTQKDVSFFCYNNWRRKHSEHITFQQCLEVNSHQIMKAYPCAAMKIQKQLLLLHIKMLYDVFPYSLELTLFRRVFTCGKVHRGSSILFIWIKKKKRIKGYVCAFSFVI